uniref:CDP-diacylglycerol--serine O-phosphatidyltransferase n=1 Tax=Archaeoglobus fulgidus TaxID=2234 RepID=A0A7C3MF01_ARCFL
MRVFKEVSLADSLSVLNALFGFTAVTYLLLYGVRIEVFVMFYLSTLADGLDGFVAKKTEKSPFGKDLDSLADSVSFGMFPAALLVSYNSNLFPYAALFLAFSLLRLARFNVLNLGDFLGVPTVVSALVVTSLVRVNADVTLIVPITILLSVLMISDVRYPRVKDAVSLAVVGVVIISAIFIVEMCYAILLLTATYITLPLLNEGVRFWRERRLKKLLSKQE